MNTIPKEDLDFLLKVRDTSEFTMMEALEAYHLLLTTVEDMEFQLKASKLDFKGEDVESWRLRVEYKLNRCLEAARKFSRRYRELKDVQ